MVRGSTDSEPLGYRCETLDPDWPTEKGDALARAPAPYSGGAGSRVSKQVLRNLSLSISRPCFSPCWFYSPAARLFEAPQAVAPSGFWLSSCQLRKPNRERAPLSQGSPLVPRDGVSSDVFGHMRSPRPWGSSLHPAQGLSGAQTTWTVVAGAGACWAGVPSEDSDAVTRGRKNGRVGHIHRCPRRQPHGDRLTRQRRALAWDPSSQGWSLSSVIV